MKQQNIMEVKEMIELENWLKENQDKQLTLSEYLEIFSKMTEEQRNYIIMAKAMPYDEIKGSLEYYDGHIFPIKLDEIAFVNNLIKKYSVDRKTVLDRIKQVRMINQAKKAVNKTKKRKK